MGLMQTVLQVAQLLSALAMVGLILMQHGKGADMGAAFGSGSAGSLFGASGSANFLSRSTAVLATVFLASTLALSFVANWRPASSDSGSVLNTPAVVAPAQPDAASQIPEAASATQAPADKESTPADASQIPSVK